MAKFIQLGLLGPEIPKTPYTEDMDFLREKMQQFWTHQLKGVLSDRPDIIALPEMCDRYDNFTPPQRQAYFLANGRALFEFWSNVARENHCYVVYATAVPMPDGTWRNAAILLGRDGTEVGRYHKNCLVEIAVEPNNMRCGKDVPVFQCDFGRVAMAICFDLNFPEMLAKYEKLRPNLILFPSRYHGGYLQGHWAYSCRSWFGGASAGLPCTVYNPVAMQCAATTNYFPWTSTRINMDYEVVHLNRHWEKLQAARDKYGQAIRVLDPGLVGAVMVESLQQGLSAAQVLEEFDIMRLDDYWAIERACWERYQED
ncbi:carbon-nitrogen hydrolase family protein [Ruminococcaceae bacterium OttesenSCG-928-D13]|nr:carbon-nitrogen hydrolase family protein [Ruminococcaceae bacterium OttesenSCG-928-D13]